MLTKENGFTLPFHCKFPDANKYAFTFIALFLFLIIIYSNSFQGQFVFDDTPNIINNANIHLKSIESPDIQKTFHGMEIHKISRPFSYFSLALNYYFGGLNVFGYHLVNFIIHYLAAIFLFLFIYNALKLPALRERYGQADYGIALLATVFWATSPLQVNAVTYIVQRMASMAGLFYIMSMYFYLEGRTAEKTRNQITLWIFCLLSAFLSFGSKENAVLLPVSIWLFDLLCIQGAIRQNVIRNLIIFVPVVIVAVTFGLWYVNIGSILSGSAYDHRPFTAIERLLTQPRIIIFYITLLLYPLASRLTMMHDIELSTSLISPWTTLPAIALILGLITIAIFLARKNPFISFAIFFYFLNLIIESTFLPLELIFEHRNYIPSMFFFVPVAIAMVHIMDYFSYKKIIQLAAVGIFMFLLFAQGHTVFERNNLFAHPILLWTDNALKTPTLSRPYHALGNIYWRLGRYEEAYQLFTKAESLNRFINLNNRGINLYNLGQYHLMVSRNYTTAMKHFKAAMIAAPNYWPAYNNAVICFLRTGEIEEAKNILSAALTRWPDNTVLHSVHSLILLKSGDYDNAIIVAKHALSLDPYIQNVLSVLGEAYRRKGNVRLATLYWERYLERNNTDLEAHFALIELYAQQKRVNDLSRTIGKAMSLKKSSGWTQTFDGFIANKNVSSYTPSPKKILAIIKTHVNSEFDH